MDFWDSLEEQVNNSNIVVDRPAGTRHPKLANTIYPFDYGYLEGTTSGDGSGIDVWMNNNSTAVSGIIVTSDLYKKDTEIKILLGFTTQQMRTLEQFHSINQQSSLLIERNPK